MQRTFSRARAALSRLYSLSTRGLRAAQPDGQGAAAGGPASRSVRAADDVIALNPLTGAITAKLGGTTVSASSDLVAIVERNGRTTIVHGETEGVEAGGVGVVRRGDDVTVFGGGLPVDDNYHPASPGAASEYVTDGSVYIDSFDSGNGIDLPGPLFELPEPAVVPGTVTIPPTDDEPLDGGAGDPDGGAGDADGGAGDADGGTGDADGGTGDSGGGDSGGGDSGGGADAPSGGRDRRAASASSDAGRGGAGPATRRPGVGIDPGPAAGGGRGGARPGHPRPGNITDGGLGGPEDASGPFDPSGNLGAELGRRLGGGDRDPADPAGRAGTGTATGGGPRPFRP